MIRRKPQPVPHEEIVGRWRYKAYGKLAEGSAVIDEDSLEEE